MFANITDNETFHCTQLGLKLSKNTYFFFTSHLSGCLNIPAPGACWLRLSGTYFFNSPRSLGWWFAMESENSNSFWLFGTHLCSGLIPGDVRAYSHFYTQGALPVHHLGITPGSTQSLLLVLHSGLPSMVLEEPYESNGDRTQVGHV